MFKVFRFFVNGAQDFCLPPLQYSAEEFRN